MSFYPFRSVVLRFEALRFEVLRQAHHVLGMLEIGRSLRIAAAAVGGIGGTDETATIVDRAINEKPDEIGKQDQKRDP
jgi:hypothetical protein